MVPMLEASTLIGRTEWLALEGAMASERVPENDRHDLRRFVEAREEEAVAELAAMTNIVLATGGGVVIRPANRERLMANGMVVYLHAPPATLYERTRRSRHRPLLNTTDRAARIVELYTERDPLYREVASCVIESGRDEIAQFARQLEAAQSNALDA